MIVAASLLSSGSLNLPKQAERLQEEDAHGYTETLGSLQVHRNMKKKNEPRRAAFLFQQNTDCQPIGTITQLDGHSLLPFSEMELRLESLEQHAVGWLEWSKAKANQH